MGVCGPVLVDGAEAGCELGQVDAVVQFRAPVLGGGSVSSVQAGWATCPGVLVRFWFLPRFASERCWARHVSYPAYLPQSVSVGAASGRVDRLWLRSASANPKSGRGLSSPQPPFDYGR